jgi:lysophospholipase L1-like esterase
MMRPYDLLLPPVIYAVVGHEMNLYFDNLIAGESSRYDFDVHAGIGRHRNDRWTCVPEQPGDYPLTVEVYSEEGDRLAEAHTVIRVKPAGSAPGDGRRVLFIGDSTTAAGQYTSELLRLFAADGSGVTLLGTKGTAPNSFEGRGGWKVDDYVLKPESPFVFEDKFDFTRYMAENGYAGLDDVCIHLGINDAFNETEDTGVERLLARKMPMLEQMIEDIRRYDAAIRIGMMLVIPPSRTQDSFGKNYGAGQSRRRYRRNWFLWNRELMGRFSGRPGIELIPLHVNLDTARNMHTEVTAANARNARLEECQSNGVHPAVEGYRQMADVLFAWLKE